MIANQDRYLLADKTRFLKCPKFGLSKPKSGLFSRLFCHFLKYSLLVFLEFTYNDNLQQYLMSYRGRIYEKNLWAQIWAEVSKIRPKTSFFAIYSSLVH